MLTKGKANAGGGGSLQLLNPQFTPGVRGYSDW